MSDQTNRVTERNFIYAAEGRDASPIVMIAATLAEVAAALRAQDEATAGSLRFRSQQGAETFALVTYTVSDDVLPVLRLTIMVSNWEIKYYRGAGVVDNLVDKSRTVKVELTSDLLSGECFRGSNLAKQALFAIAKKCRLHPYEADALRRWVQSLK